MAVSINRSVRVNESNKGFLKLIHQTASHDSKRSDLATLCVGLSNSMEKSGTSKFMYAAPAAVGLRSGQKQGRTPSSDPD